VGKFLRANEGFAVLKIPQGGFAPEGERKIQFSSGAKFKFHFARNANEPHPNFGGYPKRGFAKESAFS
jgi:hypothetical protein